MARVSVEDKALRDPRFAVLGKLLGTSKFDALGRMISIWEYCTQNQLVTLSEEQINVLAENENYSQLLLDEKVGLAEKSKKGIRIKGLKGRIEWLANLRKNGEKGGRPRITRPKPDGNQMQTRPEPGSNPLTLTTSLTLTTTKKEDKSKGEASLACQVEKPVGYFISKYVQAFQVRYGTSVRPDLRGKVQGQIKTFLKDNPLEDAVKMIQAYCQMDGAGNWYRTRGHDFTTFMENINPIRIALTNGSERGSIDWAEVNRLIAKDKASAARRV